MYVQVRKVLVNQDFPGFFSALSERAWFTNLSGEEEYIIRYAEALKALNYSGGISMEAPADREHWEDLAKKTLPVLKEVFS